MGDGSNLTKLPTTRMLAFARPKLKGDNEFFGPRRKEIVFETILETRKKQRLEF